MNMNLRRMGSRLWPARARAIIGAGLGLMMIFCLGWRLRLPADFFATDRAGVGSAGRTAGLSDEVSRFSKYEITLQIRQLNAEIGKLEKDQAKPGPLGAQIYAPEVSARLFACYRAVQTRLAYLNQGLGAPAASTRSWDGYRFTAGRNRPIQTVEIKEALRDLQQYPWAGNFLHGFRIFLLPYTIPDVSGLGGAGYSLLSAIGRTDGNYAAAEIRVTLYHEIGHHLHLSMMPENTAAGRMLWRRYLQLRGADWHGPGKVNTPAWSNSSEETFAEDFRMLYGKDQPFYQDVALGDPRDDTGKAVLLRRFIAQVAARPVKLSYQSPWRPDGAGVVFWRLQPLVIALLWLVVGICYGTLASSGKKKQIPLYHVTSG